MLVDIYMNFPMLGRRLPCDLYVTCSIDLHMSVLPSSDLPAVPCRLRGASKQPFVINGSRIGISPQLMLILCIDMGLILGPIAKSNQKILDTGT